MEFDSSTVDRGVVAALPSPVGRYHLSPSRMQATGALDGAGITVSYFIESSRFESSRFARATQRPGLASDPSSSGDRGIAYAPETDED
jgi:hypothetical protein